MNDKAKARLYDRWRRKEKQERIVKKKEWAKRDAEYEAMSKIVMPIAKEAFKEFPEDIPLEQRSTDERMCHCFAIFPASHMVYHELGEKKDACPRCGNVEDSGDVYKISDSDMVCVFDYGLAFDDCRRWGYLGVPLPKDKMQARQRRHRQERIANRKKRMIRSFFHGTLTENDLPPSWLREINESL